MSNVTASQIEALLGRLPLFTGLWNEELQQIRHLCRPQAVVGGVAVFEEGDASDGMFVVLSGSVEIRTTRNGRLHLAQPGENFGEIGMITQRRRTASAVAAGETHLLALGRDDFNRLLGRAPRVNAVILKNIAEQLAQHLVRMNNRVPDYLPPMTGTRGKD